ncbi:UNVERIFIED_CONTAM: hypothetical protein K2H54_075974, partial [Gekko kuhli]
MFTWRGGYPVPKECSEKTLAATQKGAISPWIFRAGFYLMAGASVKPGDSAQRRKSRGRADYDFSTRNAAQIGLERAVDLSVY